MAVGDIIDLKEDATLRKLKQKVRTKSNNELADFLIHTIITYHTGQAGD